MKSLINIDRSDYPMYYKLAMGFANLADGLIILCSLGMLTSSISLTVSMNYALKWHEKKMAERESDKITRP